MRTVRVVPRVDCVQQIKDKHEPGWDLFNIHQPVKASCSQELVSAYEELLKFTFKLNVCRIDFSVFELFSLFFWLSASFLLFGLFLTFNTSLSSQITASVWGGWFQTEATVRQYPRFWSPWMYNFNFESSYFSPGSVSFQWPSMASWYCPLRRQTLKKEETEPLNYQCWPNQSFCICPIYFKMQVDIKNPNSMSVFKVFNMYNITVKFV